MSAAVREIGPDKDSLNCGRDSDQRTVLMISYSYPPMGNPGALRVAKFAKYLPSFGWRPVVITPENGYCRITGTMQDHVNLPGVEVVRTGDLGALKRAAVSVGKERIAGPKKSRLVKSLLIPDRDITWYPLAYRAAARKIRAGGVHAIYSTSPNITNHLIAQRLSRRFGLPWVADFRDPWTLSGRYGSRGLRRYLGQRMELGILRHASRITVVSEHMQEEYSKVYSAFADKLRLLRNGYDHADFRGLPGPRESGLFVLTYTGTFDGGRRNPQALVDALAKLKRERRVDGNSFRFCVIGPRAAEIVEQVEAAGITDLVDFEGHRPYRDTLAAMTSSTALLLIETLPENMTTKFYEYLGARRPILAIVPPSYELGRMVNEVEAGTVIEPGDVSAIAHWVNTEVTRFQREGPRTGTHEEAAVRFSRAAAAQTLADVLNTIVGGSGTKTRRELLLH